jgi:hypothetical protein
VKRSRPPAIVIVIVPSLLMRLAEERSQEDQLMLLGNLTGTSSPPSLSDSAVTRLPLSDQPNIQDDRANRQRDTANRNEREKGIWLLRAR